MLTKKLSNSLLILQKSAGKKCYFEKIYNLIQFFQAVTSLIQAFTPIDDPFWEDSELQFGPEQGAMSLQCCLLLL